MHITIHLEYEEETEQLPIFPWETYEDFKGENTEY